MSARDHHTGREQRLEIHPTTDLSAAAVHAALASAESHAEEDRRRRMAIEKAGSLRILTEDVISKVAEFGDRLPEEDTRELVRFCEEEILAKLNTLKQEQNIEKIQEIGELLQTKALDLFKRAKGIVSCQLSQ